MNVIQETDKTFIVENFESKFVYLNLNIMNDINRCSNQFASDSRKARYHSSQRHELVESFTCAAN